MLPAFEAAGDPAAPSVAVFVHGILGSKSNWRGFLRRLVRSRPDVYAVALDLRNHGESPKAPGPHTLEACARDLTELVGHVGRCDVVVGHSFGGKVVLRWMEMKPKGLAQAWILDTPPGPRRTEGAEVERVLAAVSDVPMPIPSRSALVDALRRRGLSEAIALWMTTNLKPAVAGLDWRFRLEAIPEMLASFASTDLWYVIEDTGEVDVHVVRGGRSDRFSPDELQHLDRVVAAGAVRAHILEKAGHWLHADDPEGLLELLVAEMP